ncbi:MAG: KpsF/GutQ family sugar-phosphate isomerase [Bacteroidota bacterium]|nr:KpsF/GutQ family sugar-phosphate isomerase [Bacteroidota bacterium]MDP4214130.1 KpsF/GutQ family sugar-phosphate isomerase [Bacteroidota bacterium]MDP4251882.1 KpsF/GutQ family sugar-phosphate isomerase [Bacteroidota bacterium]
MTPASIKSSALRVIRKEAAAIAGLEVFVDDQFVLAVETIAASKGRLVISGVGKSAIVARKIVATLNSTGTSAVYMHAGDAIHGDLGMVGEDDIVMLISKSGESPEIKVLLPLLNRDGRRLIGMAGSEQSLLAKKADIFLNTTVPDEACLHNLAPTSSTTAQMVMGDALAITLMELKGFGSEDFARFHPGGILGKKLYLRVNDIYIHNAKPMVGPQAPLKEVIMEMTSKRLGATAVTGPGDSLLGVITDGDLRRMLEKNVNTEGVSARDIMTPSPTTISKNALAVEALELLRAKDISQLLVMDGDLYAGFIHIHDLVKEGII